MSRRVGIGVFLLVARAVLAHAEGDVDRLRLQADQRLLDVDPFAEAPLRELVTTMQRLRQTDVVLQGYGRAPQRGGGLIVLGRLHEALGHRRLACENLRRATEAQGLSARSLARVGALLETLRDTQGALAAYDRALASSSPTEPLVVGWAIHAGELALGARQIKEAERRFAVARARAPADPDVRRRIADVLAARGATAEACAELEAALELPGLEAGRHLALARRLGDLRRRRGEWRKAGTAYLMAWRLSSVSAGNRSDLEPQLIALYHAHGALETLAAEAARGGGAWDHVLAGDVEMARGKKARAIVEYRQALKLDPTLLPVRQRLLDSATPSERVQLQRDLVAARPDNPTYRLDLGRALFDVHQDAPALQGLLDAATRFADAPYVQVEIAKLLAAHGHPREAAQRYERALALDGSRLEYQQLLGDCYRQMGDQPRALAAWRAQLGPSPTSAGYQRLVATLHQWGEDAQVVPVYQEALTRFPADDELRRNYAEWLKNHEDLAGALAEWKHLAAKAAQPATRELASYQVGVLERRLLLKRE